MTRRRALAVFAAATALLVALNALTYSLYRRNVQAVAATLDERLVALGTTVARWLAASSDPAGALDALVAANRLEDAYVIASRDSLPASSAVEGRRGSIASRDSLPASSAAEGRRGSIDPGLRVLGGVRTRAGAPLNLLRVDEERVAAAFDGRASTGDGYSIANVRVEAAYFPIAGGRVLALEAGAEFHAPAERVRATYLVSVALSVLVAGVFAVGLVLALRSLERARLAHGRAERLAAVGQMAAMVAHEVRNPLGILRGQVELARERLPADAPPRERERFAEMLAEVDRLNRLTEDFIGLAREPPAHARQPVDLAALARAVAAETGAKLVIGEQIVVAGDTDRLRQTVRNLVLNALQVGGESVTVTIEVARAGERARLTVADDGPGVPAALATTLFDPFVTARPGGSGLGLAVARRVAERHGGTLELESTPGARGAKFSIYLPWRPC